ncbi:MAG: hypothetical protein NVS4B3_28700 [Gemmatimonadaceae bacterium]
MRIFYPSPRLDPSPRRHSEAMSFFLARVQGPYWDDVRNLIDDWFGRLCVDAQRDMRARLCSPDNRQFDEAFLELYLHECLVRSGWDVACQPEVPLKTGRPDFLARRGSESFYLEARLVTTSGEDVAASNRRNVIYDALDRLDSPHFFLWIDVIAEAKESLATPSLRRELERWLASLDPDSAVMRSAKTKADFPSYAWNQDGWQIEFRALPKSVRARGPESGLRPLGVFGSGRAAVIDEEGSLREALADKGKSHADLGLPYVVAIGTSKLTSDDVDEKNALYGSLPVQAVDRTTGRSARAPDGYWYGGTEWKHRDVSAVLIVKNLYPAFVGSQQHTLWEHPQPLYATPSLDVWRRVVVHEGQLTHLDAVVGQRELFGLPDPWPRGEPFPRG